eukprot:CAMPEP_0201107584 /NCGR_PEP_ID=MMETSP0812-20130820/57338_1 /ASSEMBLY_ACC=CAM_ASM_000668 /TAXON_ID=98059 /ORGANISM="Dinobryon sp., Strain UTEXLB2267" /LENGTH=32 /DNA_ID= /DNA_START= /DNA_END= /DNA_ORIENTATION=
MEGSVVDDDNDMADDAERGVVEVDLADEKDFD